MIENIFTIDPLTFYINDEGVFSLSLPTVQIICCNDDMFGW